MMSIYEFKSVAFTASKRKNSANDVQIINDATFSINEGDFTVIVGPSGAGKSTLLRLFNRLADPSSGEIRFRGKNILEFPVMELRRRIGWMPQLPVRFKGNVDENLALPFRISRQHKYSNEEIESAVDDVKALDLLPAELFSREADELSVGEAQRMSLLRSLVLKPDVLLMDEPTSALDRTNAEQLLEQVGKVRSEWNLTVVLVSHRPDEVCAHDNVVLKIQDKVVHVTPCCQDGDHHG